MPNYWAINKQKGNHNRSKQSNNVQHNLYTSAVLLMSKVYIGFKNNQKKLNTTDMKCIRRMMAVTLREKIRNDELKIKLGITPAIEFIKKQQLN